MTERPILKRFGNLRRDDFATHPIWIQSYVNDYDEPWWDEIDEEAFRPRVGPLPASPAETGLLVRATATVQDGTALAGFLTPMIGPADLSEMQPHAFVGDALFAFWGGVVGIPDATREWFSRALRRDRTQIFPIRFAADPALCLGTTDIVVADFSARIAGN